MKYYEIWAVTLAYRHTFHCKVTDRRPLFVWYHDLSFGITLLSSVFQLIRDIFGLLSQCGRESISSCSSPKSGSDYLGVEPAKNALARAILSFLYKIICSIQTKQNIWQSMDIESHSIDFKSVINFFFN